MNFELILSSIALFLAGINYAFTLRRARKAEAIARDYQATLMAIHMELRRKSAIPSDHPAAIQWASDLAYKRATGKFN